MFQRRARVVDSARNPTFPSPGPSRVGGRGRRSATQELSISRHADVAMANLATFPHVSPGKGGFFLKRQIEDSSANPTLAFVFENYRIPKTQILQQFTDCLVNGLRLVNNH